MGAYFCKRPEIYPEPTISSDLICDSLTKWFGEPASLAHIIYLDEFSTSFISEVLRWKLCAARGNDYEYIELVLKTYPRNGGRGPSFRSDVFFKNEINFYENILPELLRFQDGMTAEPFNKHLRLFLSVCDGGKHNAIVFANEYEQGFESRKTQLDLEHAKLVLQALAKFHAISFAMKDQNREEFERLCGGIEETYYSNRFWSWYKRLWAQICAVAMDAVEQEFPNTKYAELIKKFAVPNRFKDLVKAVNDRDNCVILHGDCVASNYMFKYEEKPTDIKLLDFQQCRCASPVLDVCSLLYNNSDLLKDEEELLKYYHETLASQIKQLGSNPEIYNWDLFKSEVKKYSYFGVAVSFENAATAVTKEFIDNREETFRWLFRSMSVKNLADVYEVKNLENKQRLDLASNFVHCAERGYITGPLLESSIFCSIF